jgi:hypothetical protein
MKFIVFSPVFVLVSDPGFLFITFASPITVNGKYSPSPVSNFLSISNVH